MRTIRAVCLCQHYDLKGEFEEYFARDNPWIELVSPDEVENPETIQHALAFVPGPRAFDDYPNLRLVSCTGAGVDALLDNPSLRSNIEVSRVIIAEQAQMISGFALWYLQGWQRRMLEYRELQSKKEWNPIDRTPPSAFPVGILGSGEIGGTLANALLALGYSVTGYARSGRQEGDFRILGGTDGLIEIAKSSRAIVNLLPLTAETRGILSAPFFENMRDDAILIHLGRGAHLVEEDLIAALDKGRPAMAALDVFATEPLPREHAFWAHSKIMLTPHVAGDANPRALASYVAEGIRRFEQGQAPKGWVDRSRGY